VNEFAGSLDFGDVVALTFYFPLLPAGSGLSFLLVRRAGVRLAWSAVLKDTVSRFVVDPG